MPKQMFIKPVLDMTSRQARKLLARVFEREQSAAGQMAKYKGTQMPGARVGAPVENPDELAQIEKFREEEELSQRLRKWRDLNPREEPLEGHRMGGTLPAEETTGIAQFNRLPFQATNPPLSNLQALEYTPQQSRGWRSTMSQSEDVARAVAEARSAQRPRYIDDEEDMLEAPEFIKLGRGPTPNKKGSLKERRGIKSSLANPGALLPPNMQGAVKKGGHLPTAAEMMTFRPQETRKYARLLQASGDVEKPLDMPWYDAAMRLARDKNVRAYKGFIPPMDVMHLGEKGTSSYERRVFRPVQSEVEQALKAEKTFKAEEKAVKKQERQQAREAQIVQNQTKAPIEHLGTSQGKVAQRIVEEADPDRLVKESLFLGRMWKSFKGGRSFTGRAWARYLEDELKRGRGSLETKRLANMSPLDYFQMVGIKFLHEPEKTAKRYDREVKSLKEIFAQEEAASGKIFE